MYGSSSSCGCDTSYTSNMSNKSCGCDENKKSLPKVKSYAQYNTYNNSSDDVVVTNNSGIPFFRKVVESGDKIRLKSGKVQLTTGKYTVLFLGVIKTPREIPIQLTLYKLTTIVQSAMNFGPGQISLQSIVEVNEGNSQIEIRNISGLDITFYTS